MQGLARVHAALRRSLDAIVSALGKPLPESDRAGFADFCQRFTHFLKTHHDGEEEIIFPALTQAATRAAVQETILGVAAWRGEHEALLGRLGAFEAACAQFAGCGEQEPLSRAAGEVRAQLFPHLDGEEAAIDAALLGRLMTAEQLAEMAVEASKHGQRVGGPKALMLFVHGLSDAEQVAQFSQIPWLVRKVLMKRIWARGFRRCLKYAHNPAFAL